MKKYILVVICALVLFITVGCGKTNQLKCTKKSTEEGITMSAEVVADLDNDNKVELVVFDNHNENMNIGISWSFDYLYERLKLKLNYLALIRVSSCFMFNEGYYRYDTITFYKLKSFDIFLQLINTGIIEITFKIGVHKDAIKYGKVYDHGTDFSINVNNNEKLYDKLC